MAFNVITEAALNSMAYSPVPFRFEDSDIIDGLALEYIVYVIINPVNITNIS